MIPETAPLDADLIAEAPEYIRASSLSDHGLDLAAAAGYVVWRLDDRGDAWLRRPASAHEASAPSEPRTARLPRSGGEGGSTLRGVPEGATGAEPRPEPATKRRGGVLRAVRERLGWSNG